MEFVTTLTAVKTKYEYKGQDAVDEELSKIKSHAEKNQISNFVHMVGVLVKWQRRVLCDLNKGEELPSED